MSFSISASIFIKQLIELGLFTKPHINHRFFNNCEFAVPYVSAPDDFVVYNNDTIIMISKERTTKI